MGLKKKQRTAEWHQQQVDQEVAKRVEAIQAKAKEKKSKEEMGSE